MALIPTIPNSIRSVFEENPEFMELSDTEKQSIILDYFDEHIASDDFKALPVKKQNKIKREFLFEREGFSESYWPDIKEGLRGVGRTSLRGVSDVVAGSGAIKEPEAATFEDLTDSQNIDASRKIKAYMAEGLSQEESKVRAVREVYSEGLQKRDEVSEYLRELSEFESLSQRQIPQVLGPFFFQ